MTRGKRVHCTLNINVTMIVRYNIAINVYQVGRSAATNYRFLAPNFGGTFRTQPNRVDRTT